MRAAILGAGVGQRLERPELPPKVLLSFGVEDVTGPPWVEIDFPEDLVKAEQEIYPLLGES